MYVNLAASRERKVLRSRPLYPILRADARKDWVALSQPGGSNRIMFGRPPYLVGKQLDRAIHVHQRMLMEPLIAV